MLLNTCLPFMTSMLFSPPTRPITILFFVCKSHCIDCLIKELRYWQFTLQPHIYPDDTYERRNPGQSDLLYVPLEFQPKMKNWIYHQSTGFLNNTTLLSSSAIVQGLSNAPWNLFPHYQHVLYRQSKSNFRATVPVATPEVVWIICGFWRARTICYIQSRSLSSCNSITTFDFSTLYTTIHHSKLTH